MDMFLQYLHKLFEYKLNINLMEEEGGKEWQQEGKLKEMRKNVPMNSRFIITNVCV
jgi:hypothetical protein